MTVDELLREHKAVLLRHRKHKIWKLPNGAYFVQPSTPGDAFLGPKNELATLKRQLGIQVRGSSEKRSQRPRRPKKHNSENFKINFDKSVNRGLADKLLTTGIAHDALQDRIFALEQEIEALKDDLGHEIFRYERLETHAWFRFGFWVGRKLRQFRDRKRGPVDDA